MLERAGIDFIVLERGAEVAFAGGASIGLQPNALRIIDQLGLYEHVYATTVPVETAYHRRPDGSVVGASKFAGILEKRHGYPILFFEREELLQILYRNLRSKEKVFCSHKVVRIESNEEHAIAVVDNGATFEGDIVVGADGVHSLTREVIWRGMGRTEPEVAQKESTSKFLVSTHYRFRILISSIGMTCEYACVFGVSTFVSKDPELLPGTSHITYGEKRSSICIVTSRNKKFWFVIVKLGRRFTFPNIPRFSNEDIEDTIAQNSDLRITNTTRLKDLFENRSKLSMVALEEAAFKHWFHGRVTILGDAAHKVTPNAGHGGNTAIESATMLSNLLFEALSTVDGPADLTYHDVLSVLERYQTERQERVDKVCNLSSIATRLQALDSLLYRVVGLTIMPLFGDEAEANASSELLLGGPPLKYVSYKGREGAIPWEGWSPEALVQEQLLRSAPLSALQALSKIAVLVTLAALMGQFLGIWSPPMSEVIAPAPSYIDFHQGNLVSLLNFLALLPFGAIGAVELHRTKNSFLQPYRSVPPFGLRPNLSRLLDRVDVVSSIA